MLLPPNPPILLALLVVVALAASLNPVLSWTHPRTQFTRRGLLQETLTLSTVLALPSLCRADEEPTDATSSLTQQPTTTTGSRPFAPTRDLLPAARAKLWIDQVLSLAKDLQANNNNKDTKKIQQKLQELQTLLLEPQNFNDGKVNSIPDQPAKSYLDAYDRGRSQLTLLQKPGAALVQNGEIRAWKRLKREEQAKEKQDELRAAFNTYTSSLSFSANQYLLNVSPAERSQMVRSDNLPDAKQVIASDMGLRYLYRNNVLTAMADARAELQYQLLNSSDETAMDWTELIALLEQAQEATDKWFYLIDDKDVQNAMNELSNR